MTKNELQLHLEDMGARFFIDTNTNLIHDYFSIIENICPLSIEKLNVSQFTKPFAAQERIKITQDNIKPDYFPNLPADSKEGIIVHQKVDLHSSNAKGYCPYCFPGTNKL